MRLGLAILPCVLCTFVALSFVRAARADTAFEDNNAYIAQSWQTEDGLPNNSVQALAQTKDGYLWVGTRDGLLKFDGLKFKSVDLPFSTNKNRSIMALRQMRDGALWISAEEGRLIQYQNGGFDDVALSNDRRGDYVTTMIQGADDAIWLGGSTNGVMRWKSGHLDRWGQKEGLAHYSARSLCEDANGDMWIATGAGLHRLSKGALETYTVKNGLLHNSVRSLCRDHEGNLWIGSHLGVTRMRDGRFTHFSKGEGLSGSIATVVFEDSLGQIWVGTFNGLNRIVGNKVFNQTQSDGTPFDRVQSIIEDAERNIWIGTRDGLFRLRPRVVSTLTQQNGLTHNAATSVMQDLNGAMWIGFWGGGLNRYENGKVTAFTTREGLSSDLVLTMHMARNGELWFGTDYDGGVNLFQNGKFVRVREKEGLRDHAVRALQDDNQNNLWIGTRSALVAYHGGEFKRFNRADGLPGDVIEVIHQDKQQRLWFGTTGGLVRRDGESFTVFTTKDGLSDNSVTAIHEDDKGTLWIGTRGGGLNRLRDGKFSSCTKKKGLFHNEIFGIVEDDFGFLWMSSREGIFRVSKADFDNVASGAASKITSISFDKSDGLVSVECRGTGRSAACKARDGRLWFPTSKGVAIVDPRRVTVNVRPPAVVIEGSTFNGVPQDVTRPLRLVSKKGECTFAFTALSLSKPEKIHFKFKLEGLDDDWIDAGNQRLARYAHLPAGNFKFHVIAANADGVWNEGGATLGVILVTPLWQTPWFFALACVALLAATAGTVRYISVQRLHMRLKAIEQEHSIEKERTRIARDMHDELGARLTEVLLLSDIAERKTGDNTAELKKISNATREVVRNLDAIVWAVDPENDSLDRVVGYIHEFAELLLETAQMRCWFEAPEHIPGLPMVSDVRHSLFSVVKEALNNIVKHSGASAVWIRIQICDDQLQLSLEDDGRGFAPSAASGFGNGLKNMERRMKGAGGTFTLTSSPGKGTQIKIQIPVKNNNLLP